MHDLQILIVTNFKIKILLDIFDLWRHIWRLNFQHYVSNDFINKKKKKLDMCFSSIFTLLDTTEKLFQML